MKQFIKILAKNFKQNKENWNTIPQTYAKLILCGLIQRRKRKVKNPR